MTPPPILGDDAQATRSRCAAVVVTDEEGLAGLEADWRRLDALPQNSLPFSAFDWARSWWRRFGTLPAPPRLSLRSRGKAALYLLLARRRGLYVVVGRQDGRADWIAPFARLEYKLGGLPLRCLEFLSTSHAGYSDLLLGDDRSRQADALIQFLCRQPAEWDCLDLRHFPSDSATPELLVRAAVNAGLKARLRPDGAAPVVPVRQDGGKAARPDSKTLRNQANRLQRAGATTRVLSDPSLEPGLIERLSEVEGNKQFAGGPTMRSLPGHEDFYRALFSSLGPQHRLYAALLEIGDRLIAYEWGFRDATRLLVYNKAYLPQYRSFSPGTMLLPAVLDYAYEQGCDEYDFVRGQEDYKFRWTRESHPSWRVEIWSPGARSQVAHFAFRRLKPSLLRVLSALRLRYMSPWEF